MSPPCTCPSCTETTTSLTSCCWMAPTSTKERVALFFCRSPNFLVTCRTSTAFSATSGSTHSAGPQVPEINTSTTSWSHLDQIPICQTLSATPFCTRSLPIADRYVLRGFFNFFVMNSLQNFYGFAWRHPEKPSQIDAGLNILYLHTFYMFVHSQIKLNFKYCSQQLRLDATGFGLRSWQRSNLSRSGWAQLFCKFYFVM